MSDDSSLEEIKFVECDACRAKPGMPTLCAGCLQNRAAISTLMHVIARMRATAPAGKGRRLTLYRDDSTVQVIYDHVKHWFFTANNTVLTVAQLTDEQTGEHRYIHWPRERFCWFKDEKEGG